MTQCHFFYFNLIPPLILTLLSENPYAVSPYRVMISFEQSHGNLNNMHRCIKRNLHALPFTECKADKGRKTVLVL